MSGAAIFLGGLLSGFPIVLARTNPGAILTRHAMAIGQMLSCGLLIHLTGGRIETHFQYFVTLAFLAFYRDWRVLLTASVVAAADHFIRGYFWPESMYGVSFTSDWRTLEHVAWIVFEDIVLVLMIRQNLLEMLGVAERQAMLEGVNDIIERTVDQRTIELREEIAERERTEETLRESDEKFRQMAENISDMFWMTSPDMQQVLYVSPAYESIWGHSPASLYAHPGQWAEAIPREDRERVFTLFSTLGTGISSASTEFQISRPDGEMRWIYGRGFPVRDAAGKVIRLTGIASDITQRKVAEAARDRLVAVVESTTDWVSMSDPKGNLLYMNLAGRNRLGFGPHEDITRTRISDFHPDHNKGLILNEALPTAIRQGTWSGEAVLLSCRGEEIPVSQVILSHKAPDGTVESFSTIIRDITEQKKTETALRLLNSAVEQCKESILITDAELDLPGPRIVFVNRAFTKMTGYTSEEVIGKTPRILQGPRTEHAVLHRLRENLERGEVFAGETISYGKDGNEFDLEWQIAPLRNKGGEITNFVAIQRDITDRKQLETRLFQSQKMETVGKLAGGVAMSSTAS